MNSLFKKKSFILLLICLILSVSCLFGNASLNDDIYLGGFTAGFSLNTKGAIVNGVTSVYTDEGIVSPAKDAGVMVKDIIEKIDNTEVNSIADVEKSIMGENIVVLTIKRNDERLFLTVKPAKDFQGNYKLGLIIQDAVNGIGTITFIKGNKFASLGHPVLDENNRIFEITGGKLYNANITSVLKGEKGRAGELKGLIYKNQQIGVIDKNLPTGVYGTLNNNFPTKNLQKIEVGECKIGSAKIISTISGSNPKEYDVTIIKCENKFKDTKNIVLKIEDENLRELTGGIVQGMSGSPIIQDGKLVGAVTHVFINDPTRGFGISIENMLNNL